MGGILAARPSDPPVDRNGTALAKLLTAEFAALPGRPEVLEVGGGPMSRIGYPEARFTVLEVSEDSLQDSPYADEVIIGDVQTIDLAGRTFDAVVFFNVLEHVGDPRTALERCASLLRPGGLVIIAGPEGRSLKGLVTGATPHFLHVAFYRWVLNDKRAGRPGYAPFPTHLDANCEPEKIAEILSGKGFELIYQEHYVGPTISELEKRSQLLHKIYLRSSAALHRLSGGEVGLTATDFVLVFRLKDNRPADR